MDRDLKRAKILISLVHDGELTDEEYRFLEKALLRYPDLKLEVYRHERLHDLVNGIPSASAPSGIEGRVFDAIRSEGPVKRMGRVLFFPGRRMPIEAVGAIAASVVILLVALISFPLSTGTDRETAVLPSTPPGTSTASVAMGEAPSIVLEKAGTPAEDVAVVPGSAGDKLEDRYVLKGSEEKPPAAPEFDKKTFSSDLTPSGMLTATGVSAERVSKIFVPPREAPLSSSKKDAPIESKEPMESPGGTIVSTTYVASDSKDLGLPATLLIRAADPLKTQRDIMDKAISLGGAVATLGTEESKEKNIDTPDMDAESVRDESGGAVITLPPEKMGELLDYLTARYPEADKDITDLKARKTVLPLRIDVGPVTTR